MNGWLARQSDILIGHFLSSAIFRPGERATTDLAAMKVYQDEAFLTEPAHFYACPPESPEVTFGEARITRDFICEPFAFPSAYQPLNTEFTKQYATYTETHTVHGWRYRPFMGHSKATLLMLHGWTGGEYRWEKRTLIPWLCRACGYTVVTLVHPYHGARTPAGARFSGEFFLSADLVRSVEACRQAVTDARTALSWLLEEMNGSIGVTGASLGAFMTYLLLCADDRPAFALPLIGHGELFDGPDQSSLTKNIRRDARAQGIDRETVRRLTRPVTALLMRPKLPPERILPINGRYDAIVTPDRAQRLFDAWEIPEAVWLACGHFGIAHTRQFRHTYRDFVERWV